jgi:N-acylneuraminate cytidylyltransferase/CMP-N,N'-diacetyllegionaminic acid synthase
VRKQQDLDACLDLFFTKRPSSLFSVVRSQKNPYFNMVEADGKGRAKVCMKAADLSRRQDAPSVYSMNASIYVYDRDYLSLPSTMSAISEQSVIYEMDETAGVDVDREVDFKFLEFLLAEGVWKFDF